MSDEGLVSKLHKGIYLNNKKIKRIWVSISHKIYKWHERMISIISHQGDANQNHSEKIASPLLQWLLERREVTSFSEDVEDREPPTLLRMWISAATVENSMEGPQKLRLPCDPAIPFLGTYLRKTKMLTQMSTPLCSCSIIYNKPDMEMTQVSNRWMDKDVYVFHIYIYIISGLLLYI